jgi:malto-oligosyltrehalose trehalohydrolase
MVNPESVSVTELHRYLGAAPLDGTTTRFGLWAPECDQVWVELVDQDRAVLMHKTPAGYHVAEISGVAAGDRYLYCARRSQPEGPGAWARPDPASRFQPLGVHGPSQVVARDGYRWSDTAWRGVAVKDLLIYELHIGALTEPGTFTAAIDRLGELVDLGVTAIELMPLADAAGRWNWGYDGVCLFAPNRNYGTPDEFRQLVDAAHQAGLAVILDVVYNHLGPEGNYLAQWGPYLSKQHTTVWGAAPNFDDPLHGPQLRRWFVANAIHWFDEYHVDALRMDAIHCMRDDSPRHVAAEISQAVQDWSRQSQRPALLIAESNVYDPEMLAPLGEGGIGFNAEWCDDFLHSMFAVVRPGEQLCHRVYRPAADLDQTLTYGYVYEGSLRRERGRSLPSARVDTSGLVYSIQHHDCIGNHPLGKRLHQLTSLDTQRAAAALLILSPAIPMLFMGEEFACPRPFQFFVDFTDEQLRRAVVEGRRREYPQHDWSSGVLPTDPRAFYDSKIGPARDGDAAMRRWYQALLALRKQWRASGLLDDARLSVDNDPQQGIFVWRYATDQLTGTVVVRLVAEPVVPAACRLSAAGTLLLDSRQGESPFDQLLPNHAKVFCSVAEVGS